MALRTARSRPGSRPARRVTGIAGRALGVTLAITLGGCAPVDTWRSLTGVDKNDPDPQSAPFTGNLAAGEAAPYPNLASVPPPPTRATTTAERQKLTQSLIADRNSAEAASGPKLPAPAAAAKPTPNPATPPPTASAASADAKALPAPAPRCPVLRRRSQHQPRHRHRRQRQRRKRRRQRRKRHRRRAERHRTPPRRAVARRVSRPSPARKTRPWKCRNCARFPSLKPRGPRRLRQPWRRSLGRRRWPNRCPLRWPT